MSVLCIAIGVIGLLGFTGAGYVGISMLMGSPTIVSLFGLTESVKWIGVGVCFVIGLLFCLNWVVLGMNCASIRKLKRRKKKKQQEV